MTLPSLNLCPAPDETLRSVARDIRDGKRTCVEVLQRCLRQIDTWEPQVKAWVHVDRDGALEQATVLDDEARQGHFRGALHGIPIGIKDIIDVAGFVTGCGSAALSQRPPAEDDAVVVRKLRRSGAVILGKTVTTAFAFFDPPVTRNPWNLQHTPGGSSSGSAAAVATGMCLGALGTQTGGSIIRPAAFCGIVGYKPKRKQVNRNGVFPFASSLDHVGPMARTVADVATLYNAICRVDERLEELAEITRPSDRSPCFGVLDIDFLAHVDDESRRAWNLTLDRLLAAGAEIVTVNWPEFDLEEIWRRHRVLMATELASAHEDRLLQHPEDYPVHVKSLIEEGLRVPAAEYIRCRRHQHLLRHSVLELQRLADEEFDVDDDSDPDQLRYENAAWDLDALLFPSAPGPAPDASSTGNPKMNSPWSFTGQAALTVPVGLSANGLPLGVQLISCSFGEEDLIDAATWCEHQLRLR
ncbi:MAG: amidase, Asp-tRNAAsn/Glu-tRNAGln amidotransferase subunit [Planctomycetaceae bacterium]|nr:amidase, Asp-tRNAAsn/Glu-tRNAGln amidotransferase subunit [Planctomycetaceae bacterium]